MCAGAGAGTGAGGGAGGAEELRPWARRGWFEWGKGAGAGDAAAVAGGAAPPPGAGTAAAKMYPRGEGGRRGSFGHLEEEEDLDGVVGVADDEDLLSDGGLSESDGYMFAGVGGGDLYGRGGRSEAAADGVEMRPRPSLSRSGSSLDFRRAMPHFRRVKHYVASVWLLRLGSVCPASLFFGLCCSAACSYFAFIGGADAYDVTRVFVLMFPFSLALAVERVQHYTYNAVTDPPVTHHALTCRFPRVRESEFTPLPDT